MSVASPAVVVGHEWNRRFFRVEVDGRGEIRRIGYCGGGRSGRRGMGRLGSSAAEVGRGGREIGMRRTRIFCMLCAFCERMSMDDTIAGAGH